MFLAQYSLTKSSYVWIKGYDYITISALALNAAEDIMAVALSEGLDFVITFIDPTTGVE